MSSNLAPPVNAGDCPQHDCQPRSQEVDRHARYQLIAAKGDARQPVDRRKKQRSANSRQHAHPHIPGAVSRCCGSKSRNQHLALQPDVENAGSFGVKSGEAGEQQGSGQPYCGIKDLQEADQIHYAGLRKANSRSSGLWTM
jgi:hypothetical protein